MSDYKKGYRDGITQAEITFLSAMSALPSDVSLSEAKLLLLNAFSDAMEQKIKENENAGD